MSMRSLSRLLILISILSFLASVSETKPANRGGRKAVDQAHAQASNNGKTVKKLRQFDIRKAAAQKRADSSNSNCDKKGCPSKLLDIGIPIPTPIVVLTGTTLGNTNTAPGLITVPVPAVISTPAQATGPSLSFPLSGTLSNNGGGSLLGSSSGGSTSSSSSGSNSGSGLLDGLVAGLNGLGSGRGSSGATSSSSSGSGIGLNTILDAALAVTPPTSTQPPGVGALVAANPSKLKLDNPILVSFPKGDANNNIIPRRVDAAASKATPLPVDSILKGPLNVETAVQQPSV